MKLLRIAWISSLGMLVVTALGILVIELRAQSSLTVSPGSTLASCPAPAAKALIFCNVAGDASNADGAWVSANGAAYFRAGASAQSGVSSFNGRTGNVLPAASDYKYSDLSSKPTTITCTTASLVAGGNGAFSASSCTLQ